MEFLWVQFWAPQWLEFSWVSMRLICSQSVRYLMCTSILMTHSVYLVVRLKLANFFPHLNKMHPSL